jgi:hypothetical protein
MAYTAHRARGGGVAIVHRIEQQLLRVEQPSDRIRDTAFGKHKELQQPISLAAPIVTTAQDPVTRLIACTGRQP